MSTARVRLFRVRGERDADVPLPARRSDGSAGYDLAASLGALVHLSEGYSGREIEQVCRNVVSSMLTDSNPDLTSKVDEGADAVRAYELSVRSLEQAYFERAFSATRPATSGEQLRRYEDWRTDLER